MSQHEMSDVTKKRIEAAQSRYQEAMRRVAPFVKHVNVEKPRSHGIWKNAESDEICLPSKVTNNA